MLATSRGTATASMVVRRATPNVVHELTNPVTHKLLGYIEQNRPLYSEPLPGRQYENQHVAICGAGPSLKDSAFAGVSQVWACNSALPYLHSKGVQNLWGVGVDQTPGLLREWLEPPDVTYLVASSCDPALVAHLKWHGRRVLFFHNAVGIQVPGYASEWDYYRATWPEPAVMVGEGMNVVSRVIYLAEAFGFERIDIHGADCCFAPGDVAHANGETVHEAYATPVVMGGTVNGREFRGRPDHLMEAVDLVRKVRRYKGRVRLMGDTLPVALLGKPDEYLDQVMRRLQPGEQPGGDNGQQV